MIFIWLDKETGDCIETQTFRQGLLMGGLKKSLLSTIRLKEGEYYYKNNKNYQNLRYSLWAIGEEK